MAADLVSTDSQIDGGDFTLGFASREIFTRNCESSLKFAVLFSFPDCRATAWATLCYIESILLEAFWDEES